MAFALDYATTELLVPFNGANSGTTFLDYSRHRRLLRASGAVTTSTAQSKYYGSSGYFAGTSGYLAIEGGATDIFQFGTGDFAIGCWFRASGFSNTLSIFSKASGASGVPYECLFYIPDTTHINFYYGNRGYSATTLAFTVSTLSTDTWYHVMFSRISGVIKLFLDGAVNATTYSNTTDLSGAHPAYMGNFVNVDTSADFYGYLQDLFVTIGSVPATADFTPPGAFLKTISNNGSGVSAVLDDVGLPAVRRVKAISRGTDGAIVGTTTTDADGRYSMLLPHMVDFNVLFEDDAAGDSYSDILVSKVTPS